MVVVFCHLLHSFHVTPRKSNDILICNHLFLESIKKSAVSGLLPAVAVFSNGYKKCEMTYIQVLVSCSLPSVELLGKCAGADLLSAVVLFPRKSPEYKRVNMRLL